MKKLSYVFYLVLAVLFTSCTTNEEQEYTKKYWKHKEKMLELEYIKSVYKIKSDVELEQTLRYLDSLEVNYR